MLLRLATAILKFFLLTSFSQIIFNFIPSFSRFLCCVRSFLLPILFLSTFDPLLHLIINIIYTIFIFIFIYNWLWHCTHAKQLCSTIQIVIIIIFSPPWLLAPGCCLYWRRPLTIDWQLLQLSFFPNFLFFFLSPSLLSFPFFSTLID